MIPEPLYILQSQHLIVFPDRPRIVSRSFKDIAVPEFLLADLLVLLHGLIYVCFNLVPALQVRWLVKEFEGHVIHEFVQNLLRLLNFLMMIHAMLNYQGSDRQLCEVHLFRLLDLIDYIHHLRSQFFRLVIIYRRLIIF